MKDLQSTLNSIPKKLHKYSLELNKERNQLSYIYDTKSEATGITSLLQSLREQEIKLKDLKTEQSSLENIFVELVRGEK